MADPLGATLSLAGRGCTDGNGPDRDPESTSTASPGHLLWALKGTFGHSRFISYFRKVNPLSTSSLGPVTLGRVLQIPNLKRIPWMEQLRGSAFEFGGILSKNHFCLSLSPALSIKSHPSFRGLVTCRSDVPASRVYPPGNWVEILFLPASPRTEGPPEKI